MNIEELIEQGKFEEAIKELKGDDEDTKLLRGFLLYRLGKYDEAIKEVSNVDRLESYYIKFECYKGLGKKEDAIKSLEEGINKYPLSHMLYYILAQYYFEEGDLDKALNYVDKSLGILPISYDYKFLKAKILFSKENYEDALVYLNDVISMNPKNIEARVMKAMCYYNVGLKMDALSEINKALDIDKNNVNLHFLKGKIYFETGFYKLALVEFKTALRLSPTADMYYHVALSYYMLGLHKDANMFIDKAISLEEKGRYYALKARVMKELSDLAKAKEFAAKAIKLDPDTRKELEDLL
ncbi:tetratricopeptide repeat protein [Sulfurisphaera ohwakuensis]|uniref:tetratricopeptide repeat protein n=1 Tax=Sulfurisphaera ohwakuensis TaxID=69656 RepID=UPI0036F2EE14